MITSLILLHMSFPISSSISFFISKGYWSAFVNIDWLTYVQLQRPRVFSLSGDQVDFLFNNSYVPICPPIKVSRLIFLSYPWIPVIHISDRSLIWYMPISVANFLAVKRKKPVMSRLANITQCEVASSRSFFFKMYKINREQSINTLCVKEKKGKYIHERATSQKEYWWKLFSSCIL